jgi:hypothetical protein
MRCALRKLGHVGVDLAAEIAATGEPTGFAGRAGTGEPVAHEALRAARADQIRPDGFSVGWIAVPWQLRVDDGAHQRGPPSSLT